MPGARSSNELHRLDIKIRHQVSSPSNGHQSDMPHYNLLQHSPEYEAQEGLASRWDGSWRSQWWLSQATETRPWRWRATSWGPRCGCYAQSERRCTAFANRWLPGLAEKKQCRIWSNCWLWAWQWLLQCISNGVTAPWFIQKSRNEIQWLFHDPFMTFSRTFSSSNGRIKCQKNIKCTHFSYSS